VTATATPVSVTWHPGDGSTVTCQGAGAPYTSADNPAAASPDCGHTYTRSSAGQPGGAFQVTATITWDITWQGAGGAGGVLAPLFTTAVAADIASGDAPASYLACTSQAREHRCLPAAAQVVELATRPGA